MSTTDKKHWIWGECVERFKKTFRISRATFRYILDRIEPILKDISPDERLAICFYRLGRGDYYYRIAEMVGRGVSTVSSIVEEVSQVPVNHLWNDCVSVHMPDSTEAFKDKILDIEEFWQFPCCWAAVDGCNIPIKCPPGGLVQRIPQLQKLLLDRVDGHGLVVDYCQSNYGINCWDVFFSVLALFVGINISVSALPVFSRSSSLSLSNWDND